MNTTPVGPNEIVAPVRYETDDETGCQVAVFASGSVLYAWGEEEWRYTRPTPENRRALVVKAQAAENERHYGRYPTPKVATVPGMASAGAEGAKS